MNNIIEKDVIVKRLDGISNEIIELRKLASLSYQEFASKNGYKLAQFHLHRALEGVFNISSHVLSRIPGAQAASYKDIAIQLGKSGIVDEVFAQQRLVLMAKYRNRLVHFYAEVTEKEVYGIINNNLNDFEVFLSAIKELLENPEKFNLSLG